MPPDDREAARALLWPLAVMVVTLLLCVTGTVLTIFAQSPETISHIALELVRTRAIAKIIALVLIVPAIVVLCALGRISGEAAIGALGSIAGFILGEITG